MANKSNELERLAREAVEHQARYARRKAQALLDLLTRDTSPAQREGSNDDLTPTQRELIEEFQRDFGMSEEEAREHLRLLGG
jgi:MoaA/NifB/PqqE/SkfB family radical SAM enzyme